MNKIGSRVRDKIYFIPNKGYSSIFLHSTTLNRLNYLGLEEGSPVFY